MSSPCVSTHWWTIVASICHAGAPTENSTSTTIWNMTVATSPITILKDHIFSISRMATSCEWPKDAAASRDRRSLSCTRGRARVNASAFGLVCNLPLDLSTGALVVDWSVVAPSEEIKLYQRGPQTYFSVVVLALARFVPGNPWLILGSPPAHPWLTRGPPLAHPQLTHSIRKIVSMDPNRVRFVAAVRWRGESFPRPLPNPQHA